MDRRGLRTKGRRLPVTGRVYSWIARSGGREPNRSYRPTIFLEVLSGAALLHTVLSRLCTELGYNCHVPHRHGLVRLAPQQLPIRLQREYGTNDALLRADLDLPAAV